MSDEAILWVTLGVAGVITYAFRLSFILLLGKLHLAPWMQRALRFVPPAALAAIIFPELLVRNGELMLGLDNPRLLAGLVASVVAWRTKSVLWTIGAGMAALWGLQALQ